MDQFRRRFTELDRMKKQIPKERNRIGFVTGLGTLMFAVLFDLLGVIGSLLGFGGTLVGIVGTVSFVLIYVLSGVKIFDGKATRKAALARVAAFAVEILPLIDMVPGFTASTWYTNHVVRKEDKEYNKKIRNQKQEIVAQQIKLQQEMQVFVNQNEIEQQQMQYEDDDDTRMAA